MDFPAAVANESLAPRPFVLSPKETANMAGQVTVRGDIAVSQQVSLTNVAGAVFADLAKEADGRVLWLHLNENAGATDFTDDSLQGHNGTCAGDAVVPAQERRDLPGAPSALTG